MKIHSLTQPESYQTWLVQLKTQIQSAQQRATLAVNAELVGLYWHRLHTTPLKQPIKDKQT